MEILVVNWKYSHVRSNSNDYKLVIVPFKGIIRIKEYNYEGTVW